jgi:hypothetical protein
MNIQEAFDHIVAKLKAARDSGVKPSVRTSGTDWVCTIGDEQTKFIIIAKKEGLMLVSMKPDKREPEVKRIDALEYVQKDVIEKIQEAISNQYGALPKV